jgi:N-acetylmuramoyl-L-alanine amidase
MPATTHCPIRRHPRLGLNLFACLTRASLEFGRAKTRLWRLASLAALGLAIASAGVGCQTQRPGSVAKRTGDEIVAAGQFIHTGARVVLWMDPGGYDAYRVERRFSPWEESDWESSKAKVKELTTPNRYGLRRAVLSEAEAERVRGGGWDLALLQRVVDQFVLHYDGSGTSRQCFKVLHDQRDLSVHFMLDLDGTIYQTLDLKERAWHATSSNSRGVGIEIANVGAHRPGRPSPLDEWYHTNTAGRTVLEIPGRFGTNSQRTAGFVGQPARSGRIQGEVQGLELEQFDFTGEQYAALEKLTAALCATFPKLKCDYPRDASGRLVTHKLEDEELARYQGILGHYHIQSNKVDPGPAFQWDRLVEGARRWVDTQAVRPQREKGATQLLDPVGAK